MLDARPGTADARGVAEDLRIEQGTVSPRSEAARTLLARSTGKWRLSAGAPDLLLLVRERPGSLAAELEKLLPGPPVLSGDLAHVAPSELLNFFHQGRRDGVLLTRSHEVERAIVLLEGNVAWACSTSPGERFGELIFRMGLIPRSSIDHTLRVQAQDHSHRRLGQLLGERGLLEPEEVWRALRHQIVEIFLGLLVLRSGTFVFLRGVDKARLPAQLALDTEALLLDGLRRLDEMEHYQARVSSPTMVLRRIREAPAADDEGFTEGMRRLLAALDGAAPLSLLAESTAMGEFEATKAAFKLLEGGWAEAVAPAAGEGGGPADAPA